MLTVIRIFEASSENSAAEIIVIWPSTSFKYSYSDIFSPLSFQTITLLSDSTVTNSLLSFDAEIYSTDVE